MKRSHVLPVLLQERYKEVNSQHNVCVQLVCFHRNVANSDRKTQDFLHLELDGTFDGLDFLLHGFLVGEGGRELASFVQTGS